MAERSGDTAFGVKFNVHWKAAWRCASRRTPRLLASLGMFTLLAMAKGAIPWPHAPEHRLASGGAYFVTAGTYQKAHHFSGRARLEVLHRGLLTVARDHEWRLEAWARLLESLPFRWPFTGRR